MNARKPTYWVPHDVFRAQESCLIKAIASDSAHLCFDQPRKTTERTGYVQIGTYVAHASVEDNSIACEFRVRFIDPSPEFQNEIEEFKKATKPPDEEKPPFLSRRFLALVLFRALTPLLNWLERRIERRDGTPKLFDISKYPWTQAFLDEAAEIRKEAIGVLEKYGIKNMKPVGDNAGAYSNPLGWRTFPLQNSDAFKSECPTTRKLLSRVPDFLGSAFSILLPGQTIIPHRALSMVNLRFHMGVVVPEGDIGFNLDGQTIRWREGEAFIFDDTWMHDAWNRSDQPRVILMIDFLRNCPFLEKIIYKSLIAVFVNFINPEKAAVREWETKLAAEFRQGQLH